MVITVPRSERDAATGSARQTETTSCDNALNIPFLAFLADQWIVRRTPAVLRWQNYNISLPLLLLLSFIFLASQQEEKKLCETRNYFYDESPRSLRRRPICLRPPHRRASVRGCAPACVCARRLCACASRMFVIVKFTQRNKQRHERNTD